MNKKNFPIKDEKTGKTYWISRSVAVVAVIFAENPKTKELNFLVGKRGPGCPDYVGCYGFICGYLDWGETREEAILREISEETGLDLSDCDVIEWKTIDIPDADARENIVTRYIIPIDYESIVSALEEGIDFNSESRGGEKEETTDLQLIPISKINTLNWAFNHDAVAKELPTDLSTIYDIWKLRGYKNSL